MQFQFPMKKIILKISCHKKQLNYILSFGALEGIISVLKSQNPYESNYQCLRPELTSYGDSQVKVDATMACPIYPHTLISLASFSVQIQSLP